MSRPLLVVHLIAFLLFFVHSLTMPPWALYTTVMALMVLHFLRLILCSMGRTRTNSRNNNGKNHINRKNPRQQSALPPLLCGLIQIQSGLSVAVRARV